MRLARFVDVALVLLAMTGCRGLLGFEDPVLISTDADAAPDAGDDATRDGPNGDVPGVPIKTILASGTWSAGASELRRDLATSVSTRRFTFATWYKSTNIGTMPFCAGVSSSDQTFVWAGTGVGAPYFQHSGGIVAAPDTGGAWPYLGMWVHLVLSVDTNDASPARRARWWINGVEQVVMHDMGVPVPLGQDLHIGATVRHTIGNKWEGGFNWTGSLAETYVIFGHALEASAFVTIVGPNQDARSIAYTGPITAESALFEYGSLNPGLNSFVGQPTWTPSSVTSTTDVPY